MLLFSDVYANPERYIDVCPISHVTYSTAMYDKGGQSSKQLYTSARGGESKGQRIDS